MGHFSFNCPHCGRPILDEHSTWKGLNEWMSTAVVLMAQGSRVVGEYDGYGHVGGLDYEKPSSHTQHSGADEADLIPEPGVALDQAAWDKALEDRAQILWRAEVRKAMEMLDDEECSQESLKNPYLRRFSFYYSDGNYPAWYKEEWKKPAGWQWYDSHQGWGGYEGPTSGVEETEEAAKAQCQRRWDEWLASEELAKMRADWESLEA